MALLCGEGCCCTGFWKPRGRGFTLLEVMIALALLAIGLVAVSGLVGRSMEAVSIARELRRDTELAVEVASVLELEDEAAEDREILNIRKRYPNRRFRIVIGRGPHPLIRQLEIEILRGKEGTEVSYRLVLFQENPN